jgi:hypothetical protein
LSVGVLVALGAPAAPASAVPAVVTVAFSPNEMDLTSGRVRKAVLVMANTGGTPVSGIALSFIEDPGITTAAAPGVPKTLAPGAAAAIEVTVAKSSAAASESLVQALVTYTGETPPTRTVVIAVLKITTPAAPAARAAPVTVVGSTGSEELIQYQSTDIFFTITNSSDRRQRLGPVSASFPPFLAVEILSAGGRPVTGDGGRLTIEEMGSLDPGDSTVMHLRLDADRPLQPGGALVVVTVRTTDEADQSVSTAVASQAITFAVLGESGVLQLLGVPALLFVPGLVFVFVLWALWRYVYPRRDFSVAPGLGIEGKVAMWIFAVLPSLAFPFLYPVVTNWLGPERDYRKAYGLDDILYVWIMAAVAALTVWGGMVLARVVVKALFVPQEGQPPRSLIAKFAFRPLRRGLRRESAVRDNQLVIVLRRAGGRTLATPPIEYSTARLAESELARVEGYIPDRPLRLWIYLLRNRDRVSVSYTRAENGVGISDPAWMDGPLSDNQPENLIRAEV